MPSTSIEQSLQTAIELHQSGRFPEAEALYRRILAEDPDCAAAVHCMGLLAHDLKRNDVAVELLQRAIALNPLIDAYYCNLSQVLRSVGEFQKAVEAGQRAVQLDGNSAQNYVNLGAALGEQGRLTEAIPCFQKSIELKPDDAMAYNNMGTALMKLRRLDDAIQYYRRAIELQPGFADAHSNLGNTLSEEWRLQEAEASFHAALSLDANHVDAQIGMGRCMANLGHPNEGIKWFERTAAVKPDSPGAHSNLGMLLLQRGDFERGWEEYEWRWRLRDFPSPERNYSQPRWEGEDLRGRVILLHAEQGLGDAIQFARYVPQVTERGGRVILLCQPSLKSLLQSVVGTGQVVGWNDPPPAFDLHCPLLSLPRIFKTRADTIPAPTPYLSPPADLVEHWRRRVALDPPGLRVGLTWAGSSTNRTDLVRSLSLSQLAPLAQVSGVVFYSLQFGEGAAQADSPPPGFQLINHTAELKDFQDAALIANLDLVISVDTVTAHLAGAMAKPVWTLLMFASDWRWMLDREDSPWYPTMRLFRQKQIGDWAEVITRMKAELGKLAGDANKAAVKKR